MRTRIFRHRHAPSPPASGRKPRTAGSPHRAGLTILELLLSLALLSALLALATPWLSLAQRLGSEVGAGADRRWANQAEALLRLIGDDLTCGDFSEEEGTAGIQERGAGHASADDRPDALHATRVHLLDNGRILAIRARPRPSEAARDGALEAAAVEALAVWRVYRHDTSSGRLSLMELPARPMNGAAGNGALSLLRADIDQAVRTETQRPLLFDVVKWECRFDEATGLLSVVLERRAVNEDKSGPRLVVQRSFRVPGLLLGGESSP